MSGNENEGLSPVGARIVAGLESLCDALESGVPLEERFTVRTMKLELRPSNLGPEDVRRIRREVLRVSQRVFAGFLGVNIGTVRAWEQGSRKPAPMACRFMDEIAIAPEHWRGRLLSAATPCD